MLGSGKGKENEPRSTFSQKGKSLQRPRASVTRFSKTSLTSLSTLRLFQHQELSAQMKSATQLSQISQINPIQNTSNPPNKYQQIQNQTSTTNYRNTPSLNNSYNSNNTSYNSNSRYNSSVNSSTINTSINNKQRTQRNTRNKQQNSTGYGQQRSQQSSNNNRRRTYNTHSNDSSYANDDYSMESNDDTYNDTSMNSMNDDSMNDQQSQRMQRNNSRRRKPQNTYGNRRKAIQNKRRNYKTNDRQSNNDRKASYVRSMRKPMTITQAKQKIIQLRKEKQEIERDRDTLNEELDELSNDRMNVDRDYKQEINNYKSEISSLKNMQFQMQNTLQANEQKINSLQNEIQMKNNQMQMDKNANNAAQQQIQTLQQSIQMKDTMIANNKNELQILQSQNALHVQTTQQQMKQINQQTFEITNSKNELNAISKELQNEKSEKFSMELKITTMTQKCERQLREINELRNNEQSLKRTLEMANNTMSQMRIEMSAVQSTKNALQNTCESQASIIVQHQQMIEEQNIIISDCKQRTLKDEELRKYLHNQIQELKGNIRVFCRVRPLLVGENQNENKMNMDIDGSSNGDDIYSVFNFKDEDIENKGICLSTPSVVNRMGQMTDGKKYNFTFDRVFRPHTLQNEIFEEIAQLVQSALDGYKVCIFAYGQTGSGKTYTMEGPTTDENDDSRGMIPRAVEKIFEHANKLSSKGWQFKCTATYLEIYNEKIRDLLKNRKNVSNPNQSIMNSSCMSMNMNNSSNNSSIFGSVTRMNSNSNILNRSHCISSNNSSYLSSNSIISTSSTNSNSNSSADTEYLELHQRKSNKNKNKIEVYVNGLSEHVVQCPADVYPLLKLAKKYRSIGHTKCNDNSSRSHSIFQLYLYGHNVNSNQNTYGVLNLIDLAGSERLKKSESTGSTLKETININQSLSCLMDVISALSKKNCKHVPYRNSKLTHLLMNYFGNQSKTLMFINLCPESSRCNESLCSLRFAAKVNDCQIGTAKRNV